MANDIRELNALIADYGQEFQSPDPRSGPSFASARLYNADYEPMTPPEQVEMVLSMLPGVGEGLDVAYITQGIEEKDAGKAATGLAGLALPFVGAGTIKQVAKRLSPGEYTYKGYNISKMDNGNWNLGPEGESFTDAADTLTEAKQIIDGYDEIIEESLNKVLSDEKATGWLKNHGYDPYVGIGPRPQTPYYEFTEDGAIKAYTPYGGNKSGVEVKTFRNPTRKQLRDWMGYKSGGRVERNPYNHEPKAI